MVNKLKEKPWAYRIDDKDIELVNWVDPILVTLAWEPLARVIPFRDFIVSKLDEE